MHTILRLSTLIYATTFVGGLTGCANNVPETIAVTHAPIVALSGLPSTPTSSPIKTPTFFVPTLPNLDPTATPYTYTIKSGDTLIAIASEQGVTVEQIQMANSGIDPLSLQAGQDLVIPFDDIVLSSEHISPIEYNLLEMNKFQCYPTPTEKKLCLGELENTTTNPVINLAVQVTAILTNGEIGPSKVTSAPLEIVMPGKITPISVFFSIEQDVWGASGKVFKADDGTTVANRFVVLDANTTNIQQSVAGKYTVTVEIHNSSDIAVESVDVLISVYNISNQLQAYRIIEYKKIMASGQKSSIETIFTIPSEQISHNSVYAHGRSVAK